MLFASPSNLHRKQRLGLFVDESRLISVDWNAVAEERGTTLTETCWEPESAGPVCMADPSLEAGVSTVQIEGCSAGSAGIKNTATFADGSVGVVWWKVAVTDDN
jgi:hypothetical protein